MLTEYRFTQEWFNQNTRSTWEQFVPALRPTHYLEIGSFEGNSACFMLEHAPDLELVTCIDTWQGGEEHQSGGTAESDMAQVLERFDHNISVAQKLRQAKGYKPCRVERIKSLSTKALPHLLVENRLYNMIYVDGSHQAPDVLFDLVVSWRLLSQNGLLAADDYPWKNTVPADILKCPKPAIDAFTQMHFNELTYLTSSIWQIYVVKL